MSRKVWEIVGGVAAGGILVRAHEDFSSNQFAERLCTGSIVEEVALKDDRLHYVLVSGSGPFEGWVSTRIKGKILAIRHQAVAAPEASPKSLPRPTHAFESNKSPAAQTESSGKEHLQKQTSIHVCAVSVSGKSVELNLARDCTVAELKRKLVKHWVYPTECLKLLVEGSCLTDAEELEAHCAEDNAVLTLTVVISLDELYTCLEEAKTPTSQVMALRKLVPLVPHGCEKTVEIMSKCLDSKATSVRGAAVEALLKVAGTEITRSELEARFQHEAVDVRLHALKCWPALLAKDQYRDSRILSMMGPASEDANPEVRKTAENMIRDIISKKSRGRGDKDLLALAQGHLKKYGAASVELWVELLWASVDVAHHLFEDGLAIFIDARDDGAFELSRIPGSFSLTLTTSMKQADLAVHPALQIMAEKPDASIIVYSDSGSPVSRCALVAQRLREGPWRAPHKILRLIGGLNYWKHHGLPIEGDARYMYAGEIQDQQIKTAEDVLDMHLAWVPPNLS